MHPAFSRVDHRPWPLPKRPWLWRQTWESLLFAHWPVPASALRPLVPGWLRVQEYDGSSWVGLVPFTMSGVTFRGMPALPWLSSFAEMNLRLYVEHEGKPGIWFVSLDAERRLAVWGARAAAHLPYFFARMRVHLDGDRVSYDSVRNGAAPVRLSARYAPIGPEQQSRLGSLEHFLTERYCLYTEDRRKRRRSLEIHHPPWPLQPASASF